MRQTVTRAKRSLAIRPACWVFAAVVAWPGAARTPDVLDESSKQAIEDAAARVELAEYIEAINVVEAAIESIEQRASRYDLALVRPLVVLGDALAGGRG